ncbi:uncharacterized protein LOC127649210 [Xyrauchen texanus]|uniref:uncharacterized protein LOC127649210 n=1 Tax=Xyrauchen texanus TaxID=154827 RepID=UPI002241AAF2|nr:uncharacterized protein LOC127649210 [Xyrauchen texanus]
MEKYSDKWTDSEVQALFSIYSSEEIQRDFESSKRNSKVYTNISAQLCEVGIQHNAKQCREKIKKLKQDYKKIKDHNNQSGSDRRTGKWFEAMDAILGHKPPYTGNVGRKASTELMASDTDTSAEEPSIDYVLTDSNDEEEPPITMKKQTSCSWYSDDHANSTQIQMEKYSDKWTDTEVQTLLGIYSTEDIQRDFESSKRNSKVYANISAQLCEVGIHHNAKQCREKLKKLKQDYKKIKDHNNKSCSDRRTGKWFETMDAILGHKPAYTGNVGIKYPAADHLEPVASDTDTSAEGPSIDYVLTDSDEKEESTAALSKKTPCNCHSSECANFLHVKMGKYSDKWTDFEVQALLNIYSSEEIQRGFESSTRKSKVYANISAQLCVTGIHHTVKQCREKLKKLKQDYKKIKDHNNQIGSDHRTGKWFEAMDAILGHKPPYNGNVERKDSTAVHLEPIASDTSVEEPSVDSTVLTDCTFASDAPSASSTPNHPVSTPAGLRVRPGKRKRDALVMALKEMREMEEARQREANAAMERFLQMMEEQESREAAARARELAEHREEAAEARRQQAAFQQSFLALFAKLVEGGQHPAHPTLD